MTFDAAETAIVPTTFGGSNGAIQRLRCAETPLRTYDGGAPGGYRTLNVYKYRATSTPPVVC